MNDWESILNGQRQDTQAKVLRGALLPLSAGYGLAMRARNIAYDNRWLRCTLLKRPVISVGNLTTGGTGKTPAVRMLVHLLQSMGHKPGVLLRGYRANTNAGLASSSLSILGDEGTLLAEATGVPVFANPRRDIAAQQLLSAHPDTSVFILDDGFQHRRIHRDLNLVLISATQPWGNAAGGSGHVLPGGLLREPVSALSRADAVLITRSDMAEEPQLQDILARVTSMNTHAPVWRAVHQPVGFRSVQIASSHACDIPLTQAQGMRAGVIAAVGEPQSLIRQLKSLGMVVSETCLFADHHAYTAQDAQRIAAASAGCDVWVTTEKDWVKLRELKLNWPVPIWRLDVAMQLNEAGKEGLERLLAEKIRR